MENKLALDKNTFGDSPAEITLSKILNELGDKKVASYASRLLINITSVANEMHPETPRLAKFVYSLLRDYSFKKVDDSVHFQGNPEISTYLKNCITKRLRKILL